MTAIFWRRRVQPCPLGLSVAGHRLGLFLALQFGIVPLFSMFAEPPVATAAVPAQYQCAPTGTADCAPAYVGPWRWTDVDLGFGWGHRLGWYESEAELNSAIEDFAEQNSSWCTVNYASTAPAGTTPSYIGGILRTEYYHPQFAYTFHKGDCSHNGNNYAPDTRRTREISCPKGGWTLTYDDASGVKPYCACPAGTVCDPPVNYQGAFCKGNPCVVTTGGKYQVERDYQASGLSPLAFTRSYTSRYAYSYYNTNTSVSPPRLEPVGIGWTASYLQHVVYDAQGQYPGLWAFRPDGSVLGFLEQADGSFKYAGELADRVEREFVGGTPVGWKYVTGREDIERYDLAGRLVSITGRGGIAQTLSYGANGLPDSVTDSFGNQLQFVWNSSRQLQALTLPDQTQSTYGYDAMGCCWFHRHLVQV